jgi:hypothetical protein
MPRGSRYTQKDAEEMLRLFESGKTTRQIGNKFKCHHTTVLLFIGLTKKPSPFSLRANYTDHERSYRMAHHKAPPKNPQFGKPKMFYDYKQKIEKRGDHGVALGVEKVIPIKKPRPDWSI